MTSGGLVFLTREVTPYWAESLDAMAASWDGPFTVVCPHASPDDLHPWKEEDCGLRVAEVRRVAASRRRWGGTLWPSREVGVILDEIDPELVVVHEYSPFTLLSGFLWALGRGRVVVVTTDVGPVQREGLTLLQRLVHSAVNRAVDGILARTQDAFDEGRRLHLPVVLAPHAVATRFYKVRRGSRKCPRKLIQVGSLISRKGVDLLLRAFARARRLRPDLELILVGAGSQEQVRHLAKDLGVLDAVELHGFMPAAELARLYGQSDAFVLASRFDTYGVVVHEAAAAGLPLVISRYVGASVTLLEHGRNGEQVDPEDEEGFAEALLRVLEPKGYAKRSAASREIARRYDVKVVAERAVQWLKAFAVSGGGQQGRRLFPGWLEWGRRLCLRPWRAAQDYFRPDAFGIERREIVFLNRYIPFYREGIFRRVAEWRSTKLLFSGGTLGNLRSAEGIESEAVRSLEIGRGKRRNIVWLGATAALCKIRPRVVCTELSLSLWSTWWWLVLRRLIGFRLVFWTHGLQEYGWRGNFLGWKDRIRLLWMRWADAVLFYSEDRRMKAVEVIGESPKFFVAPNTLDTQIYQELFAQLEEEGRVAVRKELGVERPLLLYVGRLCVEKEVLGLVEILEGAEAAGLVADLAVIGGGDQAGALQEACARYGERVRFLGPIFDLAEKCRWIYAADAMVCPGYAGLNVVDALAMGCPFFAVDDGRLLKRHSPEIGYVVPGKNGGIAEGRQAMGRELARFLEEGGGDRAAIRESFLRACSIERQFAAMRDAFLFAEKNRESLLA